jgi:adenylyltransferase/sulfurtransferase
MWLIVDIPIADLITEPAATLSKIPRDKPTYVVCRFGNDSQDAVQIMRKMENPFGEVKDIKGGLDAWTDAFPEDKIPRY